MNTRQFLQVAQNIDTMPVLLELNRVPRLWNANTARKTYVGTPHAAMDDIWVRFRPADQIEGLHSHQEEYRCAYWPAWHELPSLRPLIRALKNAVDAVELGSILITRLLPGGAILPHSDCGSWAAEFYNTKLHLTLAGQATVRCEDETVLMQCGDAWTFDNLREHEIQNTGEVDRVVLIVSMRCEP